MRRHFDGKGILYGVEDKLCDYLRAIAEEAGLDEDTVEYNLQCIYRYSSTELDAVLDAIALMMNKENFTSKKAITMAIIDSALPDYMTVRLGANSLV